MSKNSGASRIFQRGKLHENERAPFSFKSRGTNSQSPHLPLEFANVKVHSQETTVTVTLCEHPYKEQCNILLVSITIAVVSHRVNGP